MQITKKNYIILATLVAVAVFLYWAVLALFGFTKCWGTWRNIGFFLLSFVSLFLTGAILIYVTIQRKQNDLPVQDKQ